MSNDKPDILPVTKIAQLLGAYPELEDDLISMAPAFKKLRNPVLRKTVAKVATLSQVAKIGGISPEEMINALREKVGLPSISVDLDVDSITGDQPEWFNESKIARKIDGATMLDAGEFPLEKVLSELKDIDAGVICELTAPFLPSPLIEKVIKKGYSCWAKQNENEEKYNVYFLKH